MQQLKTYLRHKKTNKSQILTTCNTVQCDAIIAILQQLTISQNNMDISMYHHY